MNFQSDEELFCLCHSDNALGSQSLKKEDFQQMFRGMVAQDVLWRKYC